MKFSVIVPIYKVEKYLQRCIDSILSQSFKDFELILVDDGSPDNCPQICNDYKKTEASVKVIHKPNEGLVSARNAGLAIARGDYVCYVDGDDWIEENLLAKINDEAIEPYHPDMVIFGLKKVFSDHNEDVIDPVPEGIYDKHALNSDIYPRMIYDAGKPFCNGVIFPGACNKAYKRELLLQHSCKDERIRVGEDNAFIFECLVYSASVYFSHETLYNYNRINETSMTNSYDPNRFQNNAWLTSYLEKHLGGINDTIDGQINAFKAYWLIMAVFHEMKCKRKITESSKHIKAEIRNCNSLNGIYFKGLPRTAKIFLAMLHMRLYKLTLAATKVYLLVRQESD